MTEQAPPPTSTYAPPPAPPAATVAPSERPSIVTAAAITLIVLSVFSLLLGLLLLVGVGLFAGAAGSIPEADVPGMGGFVGAFAGLVFVIMIIVIAFGVLQLISGIKVLAGRNWARITGIVVAAIGAVFSLGGLTGQDASPIISLVVAGANGFVIWALATTGAWFSAREAR